MLATLHSVIRLGWQAGFVVGGWGARAPQAPCRLLGRVDIKTMAPLRKRRISPRSLSSSPLFLASHRRGSTCPRACHIVRPVEPEGLTRCLACSLLFPFAWRLDIGRDRESRENWIFRDQHKAGWSAIGRPRYG
ncbi:hypothetical protein GQ53DRAFT_451872 [Thozetella sp. PMI_491]|nr:hypothetical protein GQ53DRAFT_451872 [Thozetella sp. PMI_491]